MWKYVAAFRGSVDCAVHPSSIAFLCIPRDGFTRRNVFFVPFLGQAMEKARAAAPDLWILAPGVGAQGGNLREALAAGLRPDGRGIIVPVSRGISRADSPRAAADELVTIMRSEIAAAAAAQKQLASSAVAPATAVALQPCVAQ